MAKHSKFKRTTTSRSKRGKAAAPVPDAAATRPRAAPARTPDLSDKEASELGSTGAHQSDPDNPPDSENDPNDADYDPSTTSNVPKLAPDKLALKKLQKSALRACKRLSNAIARGYDVSVGKGEMTALETIQDFLVKREQALGFSSVQIKHLQELGVEAGTIQFEYEALRSASRVISDRFLEDEEFLDRSGLSHKERMAEFIGLNYFLESMFYPSGKRWPRDSKKHIKLSPEFSFEDVPITKGETTKRFGGFVDLVTFIVTTKFHPEDHDIRSVKDLFNHPGVCEGTLVTTEFKSPAMAFLKPHIAEAVAQAMAACKHSGRAIQRFIMTDGKRWKFCFYDNTLNTYYLSDTLDSSKEDKKVILTLLDEWLWRAADATSPKGLWKLPTGEDTESD